jgi:hypothetical protein
MSASSCSLDSSSKERASKDAKEAELVAAVEKLYASYNDSILYEVGDTDTATIAAAHSLAYGEVTSPRRLFEALQLSSSDCFYDLGSGRGQAVLATAMLDPPALPRKAHGIELVQARHEIAAAALQVLKARQPARAAAISFTCSDVLAVDLTEATKVFINNAVFSGEISSHFAAALDPSHAPSLERCATISELPARACEEACLRLSTITTVTASWASSGTTLYVYVRCAKGEGEYSWGAPPVTIDQVAVDEMLSQRRAVVDQLQHDQLISDAEAERIRMRNACMAATAMK